MQLNKLRRTAVWLGRTMQPVHLLCNYYNDIYDETALDISLFFN